MTMCEQSITRLLIFVMTKYEVFEVIRKLSGMSDTKLHAYVLFENMQCGCKGEEMADTLCICSHF